MGESPCGSSIRRCRKRNKGEHQREHNADQCDELGLSVEYAVELYRQKRAGEDSTNRSRGDVSSSNFASASQSSPNLRASDEPNEIW